VICAVGLATGLQFCAIVHKADGTSFGSVVTTLAPGAEVTTWNVHVTLSVSEKPTVVVTAAIVPGAAFVMLTPFKETGFAEDTHETLEG